MPAQSARERPRGRASQVALAFTRPKDSLDGVVTYSMIRANPSNRFDPWSILQSLLENVPGRN